MLKQALLMAPILAVCSASATVLVENTANSNGTIVNAAANEVVIAGVASNLDQQPGAVALQNNQDGTFTISFKEWEYLDGAHADETISTLTLSVGTHTMQDGAIWEVGTVNLSTASQTFNFAQQYDQVPYLFLSPQSDNGGFAYVARASSVNQIGFNAKVQFQELQTSANTRNNQTVSYLAIYAPSKSGNLDTGEVYKLNQIKVDELPVQFESHELFLQEEQSRDAELEHVHEVINVLDINGHLFAQDITSIGGDTATIRANKNVQPAFGNTSCKAILDKDPASQSGYYTLDPDGAGGLPEFTTFCDMEMEGGGWTLMGIRYVPGKAYNHIHNFEVLFTATQNITSFDDNYHLTDPQWVHYKNNSQEMMITMRDVGVFAIADIAVLNNASCIPLQDTLGRNHGMTGEHQFRLFWHEASGCSGSGSDYSMLNYHNIYAYAGGVYKAGNVAGIAVEQTTYIFVR
ncbi:fibrinogen-like YCDxxxxGGGW domain-containing protein [Pseudoalteromonas sp. Of7M-16]|uniref:fibrinogen-like YCDxxxxGGGW domain-containing protein n=1 Tax=Pseudoalteromonas sp. Of7M-16 TaxID=2917756 RepID=UPI001EF540D4|nr:fibrinogen-like YCDxxxxGGGW domain-containing protein [Pseudoalteromonas sp. Of7M-16]MCG7546811.1 hypothetical protein [Pseudoalteromonas sp. Of7M-16]